MICPQCHSPQSSVYSQDKWRSYFQCQFCFLIFIPRDQLLTDVEEKNRYQAHQNQTDNMNYKNYLASIADSILPHLNFGDRGLDYGCGETTLLSSLLTERGYITGAYDLYFRQDETIWSQIYDFIILSEVIEHFRDPREELKKLNRILKKNGKIFIKTKFYPLEKEKFIDWFYKRDLTHVQFYQTKPFEQISLSEGFKLFEQIGNDLYVFRK